jgi:vesicle transport protein SEC22
MVRLTLVSRVADGLPLAEGLDAGKDAQLESCKAQAKALFKHMTQSRDQPQRLSIESGSYMLYYIISSGACFLTVAEKGYPKKLAFQYLEELVGEFGRLYGSQIDTVTRPFAFIKFDTFIQKTKKLYVDTRTQRNLAKLNDDLAEVQTIMTKTISEVLGQGDTLNQMTNMSAALAAESKKYAKRSDNLHKQALLRKYMPFIVVIAIVFAVLWIRRWFYKH